MRKNYLLLFLFLAITISGIYGQALYTVKDLVEMGIRNSDKLKMLEARIKSVSNKIDQVSNLPDPIVKLGVNNMPVNSFSFTQEPMTSKSVAVSQGIPFPGKLSSIEELHAIDTLINRKEFEEEKLALTFEIRKLSYELFYLKELDRLTKEKRSLLEKVNDVVATKYEVSKASQQNLFSLQLALAKIDSKLIDIEGKRASLSGKLETLVGTKVNEIAMGYNEFKEGLFPENLNNLLDRARKERPYLIKTNNLIKKTELLREANEYSFYPDFNISVQYSQRDEIAKTNTRLNDFLSFGIGFNLPLNYGGKASAKISEAISLKEVYERQYGSQIQQLESELKISIEKLNSLRKRIDLFGTTMKLQAEENYKAALGSYQVDKVDFVNVINGIEQILEIDKETERLKMEARIELAKIDRLTGANKYGANNEK